jgi:parallel beta-helix repeat protein
LCLEELEARTVLSAFYVAPMGSDSSPGTSAAPWATLQHAVDSIQPGDSIEVESGTYQGCRIGNSGIAAAPCTLEAAAGASVVINAPGPANKHGSDIEVENFDGTVSYWNIKGLEVTGAPTNAGIDIRVTTYITVQNCYCHENNNWGIFLAFSDHPTITGNHCSYSKLQHGIYDSNSGDYAIVTNNECDHNADCGIEFNGDASQGGKGYMVGNLIAGNIIHDNGAVGGAGLNFDGLVSSTVENNLLYNNHAGGIALYKQDAAVGSHDDVIVNNTIVTPAGSRWAVNINSGSTNDVLYNNIIAQQDAVHGCIVIDSSSLSGFKSDYNLFSGHVTFSKTGGRKSVSLAQWRSGGQDLHSQTATLDALFVNYTANDYHLSSTSPAIDAGTSTDAPSTDLDGLSRPWGNGFDIGCYEYQGTIL